MKVRGTMEIVPEIEVNVDTVYIRTNVVKIEEEDFVGWEYDEMQISKDEYIEKIAKENEVLKDTVDRLVLDALGV